jgi:hypothetical protein
MMLKAKPFGIDTSAQMKAGGSANGTSNFRVYQEAEMNPRSTCKKKLSKTANKIVVLIIDSIISNNNFDENNISS